MGQKISVVLDRSVESSMIPGILKHRLGSSRAFMQTIDPALVSSIVIRRRAFRILDRDLPWTLRIGYDNYVGEWDFHWLFQLGPLAVTKPLLATLTPRYPDEASALADARKILWQQGLLQSHSDKLREEILSGKKT